MADKHKNNNLQGFNQGREVKTDFSSLINKRIPIPEINTQHFDNSDEYVVTKNTRKGVVKVLKPEVLEAIKKRLEEV